MSRITIALNRALDVEMASSKRSSYTVIDGLGQGGFGVVVLAKYDPTGEKFALKRIPKHIVYGAKGRKHLKLELYLMAELAECPFLLRCHAAFETKTDIFMINELLTGGDLFYHMAQRKKQVSWFNI